MKVAGVFTVLFAALAVANPIAEVLEKLENREECVGNLGQCNKKASAVLGKQCCGGFFCCGVVGPNNVCQTENTCGE